MRRQIVISLMLIVALLATGVATALLLIRTAPTPPIGSSEPPALFVRGLELKPQTVVEQLVGYGTARADRYAWIAAQVSGKVAELRPDLRVGVSVDAGELLVRIDDREYQHQLDRARSLLAADEAQLKRLDVEEKNLERVIEIATIELEIARREYERVLALLEAGQAPRREVDVARQGHEAARRTLQTLENSKALLPQQRAAQSAMRDLHRAEVALAELNVERCSVCAPFRGRLEAVEIEIGEHVDVGARLIALLDPDLIEVPIELPVSLRDRVASGATCRLTLESNRDVAWSGQVARIAPSADQATRTFALFVEVDNTRQEPPLMPGLFVHALIDGPTWRDVLIVPRGVIQQEHVYVYEGGLVRRQAVSIERHLLKQTVVRGLKPGDVVITSNLDTLFDGAPVRIQQHKPVVAETGSAGVSPAETGGAGVWPANRDKRENDGNGRNARPTQARSDAARGS